MDTVRITIQHRDGRIMYVDTPADIAAVIRSLPKTVRWKHGAAEKVLRNKYFLMLGQVVKAVETGYNKTDLHEALKPMIFTKLKEFPQYFKDEVYKESTQALTHDGWVAYIDQFKLVVNDTLGYAIT